LALPNGSVTSAATVPAGQFIPPSPAGGSGPSPFARLPAFCRIAATLTPSSDSDIKIEVWMPLSDWNGKFQAVGNGGYQGSIPYTVQGTVGRGMADALKRGYATAATDTGHSGNTLASTMGHPEKLVDFGYRAVHVMTVAAKTVIAAFYGRPATHAYWNACSSGGRQGLMEAQRYPSDYDGIIAGSPANPSTRLGTWNVYVGQATLAEPTRVITPAKFPMIHAAVVNACDGLDGLKDGLIDDPRRCHFDFATLECKGADTVSCLTPQQVASAKALTTPLLRPGTKDLIFPGLALGAELGWARKAGGPDPSVLGTDFFKYVVYKNANWDWRTFEAGQAAVLAERIASTTLDAREDNLRPFHRNGGKLLMFHGWADQNFSPEATIQYYTRAVETLGESASRESLRLFLAPGMAHCGGGEGPNEFDALTALEEWVEHGRPPDLMIAAHRTEGRVDRTRPLCAYPQTAHYNGSGSMDEAMNFVCR
jgi:feruloyl esterase